MKQTQTNNGIDKPARRYCILEHQAIDHMTVA